MKILKLNIQGKEKPQILECETLYQFAVWKTNKAANQTTIYLKI